MPSDWNIGKRSIHGPRTPFAITRPDAGAGHAEGIIAAIEKSGLSIRGLKRVRLSGRPLQGASTTNTWPRALPGAGGLRDGGPRVMMCLEGEGAPSPSGATSCKAPPTRPTPPKAPCKQYGTNIGRNATHGKATPPQPPSRSVLPSARSSWSRPVNPPSPGPDPILIVLRRPTGRAVSFWTRGERQNEAEGHP
ncbi:MAG: hypothetical protein IPL96_17690 [Holophagaceae bacterium]|nr:hypothetical protein [Holophagaceae bacterium]